MNDQTVTVVVDTPILTMELFAERIGVTKDSVRGMLKEIPTRKIGKRRFINMVRFTEMCLKEEAFNSEND